MSDRSPSLKDLKTLDESASTFKKLECWHWMYDSDLFGVQNPQNEEIGYCCVLGRARTIYGLAVYLGREGLEIYLKMQSGTIHPTDWDIPYMQKCLMVSFEDRKKLDNKDIEIIKKLGSHFRGSKEWPLFRSYQPGYAPWYLTKEEVHFLSIALEQTIEIAQRFREDKDLLIPPKKDLYLIRIPDERGGEVTWKDAWLKPVPISKEKPIYPPVDEIRLEKVKRISSKDCGIWEIDYFYSPFVVTDKERPYFPIVYCCIDRESEQALDFHLSGSDRHSVEFRDKFIGLIERLKCIPTEIFVRRGEIFDLLKPITKRLGVEIYIAEELEAVREFQNSMVEYCAK